VFDRRRERLCPHYGLARPGDRRIEADRRDSVDDLSPGDSSIADADCDRCGADAGSVVAVPHAQHGVRATNRLLLEFVRPGATKRSGHETAETLRVLRKLLGNADAPTKLTG
jgi:hypothetical protein